MRHFTSREEEQQNLLFNGTSSLKGNLKTILAFKIRMPGLFSGEIINSYIYWRFLSWSDNLVGVRCGWGLLWFVCGRAKSSEMKSFPICWFVGHTMNGCVCTISNIVPLLHFR
jgi:hypothetical protein